MKIHALLLLLLLANIPGAALAQQKFGMFNAGHKFDPPAFVVLVDKQYTQNGVMDDDMYFIASERVDGSKVFFAGAQSDVKTIGGPFSTIEELAAVLPDKASAWTPDMARFAARPAGAAARSGAPATSTNRPLQGTIGADLSPTQMEGDPEYDPGHKGGPPRGGRPPGGPRTRFPPLATILFGLDPGIGEVKGKVFKTNPDGTIAHLLGTFEIFNRDEMRVFPAGADTLHVLTLQAPEDGVLHTDYVHFATTSGGGNASVPDNKRIRSSGVIDFMLSGGPNVDAKMQEKRITVSQNIPGGGAPHMTEVSTRPFPIRFIPDP